MANGELDDIRTNVLAVNSAQEVLKALEELSASQAWVRTRWIWELLQNARDAGANTVTVEYAENNIIFQHNGDGFTAEEICHLIYHGSTKTDDADTIGRYGSGFLTTHLLSNDIKISGRLNTNEHFHFLLTRKISSVDEIRSSMNAAWDEFDKSRRNDNSDTRTEFHYPLNSNDQSVNAAVDDGIKMLRCCAPFIIIFNNFSDIKVKAGAATTTFKVQNNRDTEEPVQQVIVEETRVRNGTISTYERKFVVANDDIAQVTVPLESYESYTECRSLRDIPKLFVGFPLIHTEEFGFPAVINSLKFTPTENRDGVFLGQNDDHVNCQNEEVVRKSCGLLVTLIEFAAAKGWRRIYELARVPKIVDRPWLNERWLRKTLRTDFVDRIRKSAIVINESGEGIPPDRVCLPSADGDGVPALWGLTAEWGDFKKDLPRQDEAVGWRDAAMSWATTFSCEIRELYDGTRLAKDIHRESDDPKASPRTHRVNRLDVNDQIDWLNRVISFLMEHNMRDVIAKWKVVPSQEGFLRTLGNLHKDKGVDRELKDIAGLVSEWRIRTELRHTGIHGLDDEPGAGEWDNHHVVGRLIERLSSRIDGTNGDEISYQASARLFAWIVGKQDWNRLLSLPVFSEQYRGQDRDILKIGQEVDDDMVLSPVPSWRVDVRKYADLFPKKHILAHFYFDRLSDEDAWTKLDDEGLIRRSVIVKEDARPERFLDDGLSKENEHRARDTVAVTKIAFMSKRDVGIIDRVRRSRPLAQILWRFLTEWMVNEDREGLQVTPTNCVCGETHNYYPAEWITPLVERTWVPGDGRRPSREVNAQSLAGMLRDSGWSLDTLKSNPAAISFLKAIGVTEFDLTREFMVTNDVERTDQEQRLARIIASGDLDSVIQFVEDREFDHDLPAYLGNRRERRRIVHDNQRMGAQVEQLVKLTLEEEGFQVTRHGIGADFRIEFSDAGRLELERAGQTWFVEVKATREAAVRMTERQVRAAVEQRSSFLLCVVPIVNDQLDEPELEDVQNTMRFVPNIGNRLEGLCEYLDEFVTLRDGITGEENDGVQLEVESGAVRVRVVEAVWTDDGFPLADLLNNLVP